MRWATTECDGGRKGYAPSCEVDTAFESESNSDAKDNKRKANVPPAERNTK